LAGFLNISSGKRNASRKQEEATKNPEDELEVAVVFDKSKIESIFPECGKRHIEPI
jgi:hypothetical protein